MTRIHHMRRAFTLMEMLVVVSLIVVLSSMVVGLSYRSIRNAMFRNKTVEILSILRTGINQAATEGRSIIAVDHPLIGSAIPVDPSTVVPAMTTMPPMTFDEFPIYHMERSKCKILANKGDDQITVPVTNNQKIFEYLFASTGQLEELRALGAIYRFVDPVLPGGPSTLPFADYDTASKKFPYRIKGTYVYDSYGAEILTFPTSQGDGKELVLMSTGGVTKLPSGNVDSTPRFGNPATDLMGGNADDRARYADNLFDGRP